MNNSTNFVIDHEVVDYVKNADIRQIYALIMNGHKEILTSALFGSCMYGNERFVKEAIKLRKINYNIIQTIDSDGWTPIKYAERNKYPKIKKMLEEELEKRRPIIDDNNYKTHDVRELKKYEVESIEEAKRFSEKIKWEEMQKVALQLQKEVEQQKRKQQLNEIMNQQNNINMQQQSQNIDWDNIKNITIINYEVTAYMKNANKKQLDALIMNSDKNLMISALFASCILGNEYFVENAIKMGKLNYDIIQTVNITEDITNGLTPIKCAEMNGYSKIKEMLEKELERRRPVIDDNSYKICNIRELDRYVRQKSLENKQRENQRRVNQLNEGGVHQQLPIRKFSQELLEKRAQQEVNQELFTSRY